jgi:hypothetical protein
MYWKFNPGGKPAGTDEEAKKRGLIEMHALVPLYDVQSHADKRYGLADMAGIQTYINMFREEGVIPRALEAKDVVTNDLIDEINKFDQGKVRELARNWK